MAGNPQDAPDTEDMCGDAEEESEEGEPEKKVKKREKVARLFARDGRVTAVVEGVPLAGYLASAVHAAAGNPGHARRAAGRCTNSNLALAGGLAGGLGGGPAGAAAGAAAGSLAGQMAERGVNHFIADKEVRSGLGSLGDIRRNPAKELVLTAGLTVVDGAMGALGGHIDLGAQKVSQKVVLDGTRLMAESGLATASKAVTAAVTRGSTQAVKKAVSSGLKLVGTKTTEALAEGAETLAERRRVEREQAEGGRGVREGLEMAGRLVVGLPGMPGVAAQET